MSRTWRDATGDQDPPLPAEVGPYRILERIGEGAAAEVYLAQQREPVQRRVALKVLKPGLDSGEVLARFAREQQALAVMSHDCIACVLDAGRTAAGRPYFAMEYVPGLPITTYCDRRALPVDDRLRLFVRLCDAVQHAHHKGVIHRDLKPSNILVAEEGGVPLPKVIDFGIAKAIAGPVGQGSLLTRLGTPLGTPAYMSPEQAAADPLEVDARTDVYSLGVVLHELLAGVVPFEPERLCAAGFAGMLAILREEAPARPSERVAAGGEAAERVARARGTDQETLGRGLAGDLDWIVLTAIAKDRGRRYVTPRALAADVERFLCNEPITARPDSVRYRLGKFVRRNHVLATGAAAASLCLVGGLAASLVFLRQARAHEVVELVALADTRKASAEAEQNLATALRAVDEMLTQVGEVELAHVPHMEELRSELLQRALVFYERFLVENAAGQGLRLQVAQAHERVGWIQRRIGAAESVEQAFRAAVAEYDAVAALEPDSEAARSGSAWSRAQLAVALQDLGRPDEARELYERATERLREAAQRNRGDRVAHVRLARALYHRATLEEARDAEGAKASLRLAIEELRPCVEAAPDGVNGVNDVNDNDANDANDANDVSLALQLVSIRNILARAETNSGAHATALALLEESRAAAARLLSRSPHDPGAEAALAETLGTLARVHFRQRDLARAIDLHSESVSVWGELVDSFPAARDFRYRHATSLLNLAAALIEDRLTADGREALQSSSAALERLVADHPDVTAYRRTLAACYRNLGAVALAEDAAADVERACGRVVELCAELRKAAPGCDEDAFYLAAALRMRGLSALDHGQRDLARADLTAAIDVIIEPVTRSPEIVDCRRELGASTLELAELFMADEDATAALQTIEPTLRLLLLQVPPQRRAPSWEPHNVCDLLCVEAHAHAGLGDAVKSRAAAESAAEWAPTGEHLYASAAALAASAALEQRGVPGAGVAVRAVDILRQARARGYVLETPLGEDERFAALRSDPAFAALAEDWK